MELWVHGKKHVLQGATSQHLKTANKNNFIKALKGGVHFSMLQLCHNSEGIMHALTVLADQP